MVLKQPGKERVRHEGAFPTNGGKAIRQKAILA